MAATPLGICVGFMWVICFAMVISSFILTKEGEERTGEIGIFYQVEACSNAGASVSIADGTAQKAFDAYTLRAIDENTPAGEACPTVPVVANTLPVYLQKDDGDGFRERGGKYKPVVMLPTGTYASLAIEVVDQSGGTVLLPPSILALGPEEDYPWTADSSKVSVIGRRLLFGGGGGGGALALDGDGGATAPEAEAEAEEDEPPYALPAPGSRRLLKGGGSSGGGRGGSSSFSQGGRASTAGSARWGGSSAKTVGGVRRGSGGGGYTSRAGTAYGSRSVYVVGGTRYYAGSRAGYMFGSRAFLAGSLFYFVGYRSYYGRGARGGWEEKAAPTDLDRYEIDLPFKVPEHGSSQWPLAFRVFNMTVFAPRDAASSTSLSSSAAASAYVTFYTEDAAPSDTWIAETLSTCGWWGLVLSSVFLCCFYEALCNGKEGSKGGWFRSPPIRGQSPPQRDPPGRVPASANVVVTPAVPQYGYAQPTAGYAVAQPMPVAGAYAVQMQPSQPLPVAQPHMWPGPLPTAYPGPVPTAYPAPGGTSAYPTAYPSNPPSPPTADEAARGKNE